MKFGETEGLLPAQGYVLAFSYSHRMLSLHVCYAEACKITGEEFRLIRPFQRGWFLGCHGSTGDCRVHLLGLHLLSKRHYQVSRVKREPWMDVEEHIVRKWADVLSGFAIEVADGGFRRVM